ncbi:MAG: Peptidyl-prolyl cis-trans isomerase [uncultured bacterium (gcode 4)]|uniref:Peptidyl-prolyl cis-trans isomerase n=1 Tax=uncultured bacterium (gcode 4) TaxID=1234023 RepID=K2GDZ6_9BACT|nr:MAG: Peptidyl-prolyl cis-trans isomerase [uncultured bacterium (gcode 4)]
MKKIILAMAMILCSASFSTAATTEVGMRRILIRLTQTSTEAEKIAVKNRVDSIVKRLQNGEDFRELAKKESDDQETAKNGGNWGYITPKPGSEDHPIFKLKPGERSDYFVDPLGVWFYERYTDRPTTVYSDMPKSEPTIVMSDHEFKICASAYRDNLEIYYEAKEARESYEIAALDNKPRTTKSQLLEKLAKLSENNATLSTCKKSLIDINSILEYCPQAQYSSNWCDAYLGRQEVIDAKAEKEAYEAKAKKAKEEEDEVFADFQQCAGTARDVEGQEEQYEYNLRLYNTGFSSISYSQMIAEQQNLNKGIKKLNSKCGGKGWRLPIDRVRGLCSHPAYTSEWCSQF